MEQSSLVRSGFMFCLNQNCETRAGVLGLACFFEVCPDCCTFVHLSGSVGALQGAVCPSLGTELQDKYVYATKQTISKGQYVISKRSS